MFKDLLILIIFFFFASCKINNNEQKKEQTKHKIETIFLKNKAFVIYKSYYKSFDEAKAKIKDPFDDDTSFIRKRNGKFSLKLNTNKSLLNIEDYIYKEDIVKTISFTYLGKFSDPDLYVLSEDSWEHSIYNIIPLTKDTILKTVGFPKISENKKYLATIHYSGLGGFYGELEIFNLKNNYSTIASIAQDKWAPIDFYWDHNELIIKAIDFSKFATDKYEYSDFYTLRVKIAP